MTDKIVILSTCASEDEAEKLARGLVEARLAACVNVIPRGRSFYRWKGEIEAGEECLLLIKSSRPLFEPLRAALEKVHPYEIPEIIAMPIVEGSENYLSWIAGELGDHESET
jgi:periplasmic divalent cation tolerance protein